MISCYHLPHMKKFLTFVAGVASALALTTTVKAASLLTFDDVTVGYNPSLNGYTNISWGNSGGLYDGINWVAGSSGDIGIVNPHYYQNYTSGSYVADLSTAFGGKSGYGYANGLISGNNVMDFGGTASMNAQSGYTFDLISGYFTSAWSDNTTFTFVGFLNGVQKYSQTVTLDTLSPTLITLNFMNVDKVGLYGGNYLAADNLSFNLNGAPGAPASVPEPSTYALFGIGALALVMAYRRKVA
jgi:PEP-CTERM motif